MSQNVTSNRVPEFTLGERIRKAREDKKLSQTEFGHLVGHDRKTVGNWEAGRTEPTYGALMLVSSVADVSLEWLAGDLFRDENWRAVPQPRKPVTGRRTSRATDEFSTLMAA